MTYELNTDEFYGYGSSREVWSYMNLNILLADEADPVLLQTALDLSFVRYPYFKTALAEEKNPGRLVLKTVEKELPVLPEDGFVPLGDPRLSGHLLSLSFHGKALRLRVSHVLTDGIGIVRFAKTLLITYFKLRYEKTDAQVLAASFKASVTEKEYDNPFTYVRVPEFTYRLKDRDAFQFDEKDIQEEKKTLIRFSVPAPPVLRFAKSTEASVAAVGAWLLMNAVSELKNPGLPIKIAVPFDMRKTVGCTESNRNCNTTLYLTTDRNFLQKDIALQLTALRGQMFLQMDPAQSIPKMQSSFEWWQEACKCKTVEERIRFYTSGDGLDASPLVSYVGTFDLGEYEKYYEYADVFTYVTGIAGILMMLLCTKDRFVFTFSTTLREWKPFMDTVLALFEKEGIPHSEVTVEYL